MEERVRQGGKKRGGGCETRRKREGREGKGREGAITLISRECPFVRCVKYSV